MMETYRTAPALGRPFTAEEFKPGKNQVVLLSYSFWQARFAGDPNVVGRTMRLDGESVTVIGVMPVSFEYPLIWGPLAFWRPLNPTADQLKNRTYRSFLLVGRLAPGISSNTVPSQFGPLALRLEKEFPQEYAGLHFRTRPFHSSTMDSIGVAISWTLLGLSGFVLLIACANLANLQLARATASLRDFAIRAALGASRRRLIIQQLTESVVLSLVGGGLGFVVALWINGALERTILIGGEASLKIPIDRGVLATTFGVALIVGLVFGLAPALFASRVDVNHALKSQSRGSTSNRSHNRLRHALIVGEVALALVLLAGAAIMNRGFSRLLNQPLGWDHTRIITASLAIPESRYDTPEKRTTLYRQVEERVAAIPGVERAAIGTALPIYGFFSDRPVFADPAQATRPDNPSAMHCMVSRDYFATLGIRFLEGQPFAARVENEGPQYAIVNESLARRFWPHESAIGKRLGNTGDNNTTVWREIVGVVADIQAAANIENPSTPYVVYKPFAQEPWSFANIVARSEHPEALAETIRRAVAEVVPDLPIDQPSTVREVAGRSQHNLIMIARLLLGFAVLGLVLAAIGLYGVISHIVAMRIPEFGLRLALGAQPRDVLANVLKRGMTLTAIGLAGGLLGAWGLGRLLASFMPRLAGPDPFGIFTMALLLLSVAVVACWIPARRATKVDPIVALRSE
jgi:predicted permease